MRRLLHVSTMAILGCAFVSPALACINDRETPQSEREFKSNYLETTPKGDQAPEYGPSTTDQLLAYGGVGSGVALLVGATLVTFRSRRDGRE